MSLAKGTKITVNRRHRGCAGSTGRIAKVERIGGRTYYDCRLTGGKGRGEQIRFLASELEAN